MQERVPRQTARVAGAIIRSRVATYGVAARVPQVRVVNAELRVIEDVKRFGTELQASTFRGLEMLSQGHVEVGAARIIQEVTACIAEGESARGNEGSRIAQDWAEAQ